MSPATHPPPRREALQLMVAHPGGPLHPTALRSLPDFLDRGDVLVVNDAATFPASLPASLADGTQTFEIRLAAAARYGVVWCVLFGEGSWRVPTEHRGLAPRLTPGQTIILGRNTATLAADVIDVDPVSARLVQLSFTDPRQLWNFLYTNGRPIQYSYLDQDFPLDQFQTIYAARPWAAEMPSAGRGLTWSLLEQLRARGVEISTLTHAAGLSSTGDPQLDARLPLPERYDIPQTTVDAIAGAQARGRRIVAVGTTVVRALEGAARKPGGLTAGSDITDLRLSAATELRVVDSILTGMHGPGESHFELLGAFAPRPRLTEIWNQAATMGFLCHEFGDLSLILGS